MEKIYLNIAGFTFLVNLNYTDKIFHMNKFSSMLKKDYKGFIIKSEKEDFVLNIYDHRNFHLSIRYSNSNENYFAHLFSINEKKKKLDTINIPSQFDFESIIGLVLHKILLPQKNGFVLHGSAVVKDQKIYIFEGESGAGKSTTAQLLKGKFKIFADDNIIIRRIGNKFTAYQPFLYEKNYNFKKSGAGNDIKKVFYIKKSQSFYLKNINNKILLLKLILKQIYVYKKESFPFSLANEFMNKNNFYELGVKNNKKEFNEFFKKAILDR